MRITLNELRALVKEVLAEVEEANVDVLQQINDHYEQLRQQAGKGWKLKEKAITASLIQYAESRLLKREVIAVGVPSGEVRGKVTRVDLELDPLKRIVINLSVIPVDGSSNFVRVNKVTQIHGTDTWSI